MPGASPASSRASAPLSVTAEPLLRALALITLLPLLAVGSPSRAASSRTSPSLLRQLSLLPDLPSLRRQLLIGDLSRLRAAYPGAPAFGVALAGVWLPDGLVGAGTALWRRSYGFELANVERFAAAGFHPAELLVASGRFQPARVRATLLRNGYWDEGGVLARGADGSIDATTPAGRLTLSALDRILVSGARLRAASTGALVRRAVPVVSASLAADADLAALARALGATTSVAIFPAAQVRPVQGVLFMPLARRSARLLAVALDDAGPGRRTIKIALVYARRADAAVDARIFEQRLPGTGLSDEPRTRFADIAAGLHARVLSGRVVLISGSLRPREKAGIWRGLLERGDLAVLVRSALPG